MKCITKTVANTNLWLVWANWKIKINDVNGTYSELWERSLRDKCQLLLWLYNGRCLRFLGEHDQRYPEKIKKIHNHYQCIKFDHKNYLSHERIAQEMGTCSLFEENLREPVVVDSNVISQLSTRFGPSDTRSWVAVDVARYFNVVV